MAAKVPPYAEVCARFQLTFQPLFRNVTEYEITTMMRALMLATNARCGAHSPAKVATRDEFMLTRTFLRSARSPLPSNKEFMDLYTAEFKYSSSSPKADNRALYAWIQSFLESEATQVFKASSATPFYAFPYSQLQTFNLLLASCMLPERALNYIYDKWEHAWHPSASLLDHCFGFFNRTFIKNRQKREPSVVAVAKLASLCWQHKVVDRLPEAMPGCEVHLIAFCERQPEAAECFGKEGFQPGN
eukprot:TRINITY_DN1237_c0_g1_i4.p1 TRINITY_DN1237_c0_g1~~TRINITY_DN1237_c0_g1_i4.p1  ORF type:complete len:245 (-),score=51.87 TRINITY_DN1237_c0_g1_i4:151-885(-)